MASILEFDDLSNQDTKQFYFKNDSPTWKGNDNIEHTLEMPVFGQNIELSVFDDVDMTASGQTWKTYVGLQVPTGKAGTYLVYGYAHLRMNTTSYDTRMRLSKNGTSIGEPLIEELKDSSSKESMPRMLMKKVTLAEGDYLDLDFATESTSGTVTVREGCIVLWRIA